ncbi:hypothetical protein SKAU_G00180850 [Synaphobranchus kaupii]|uniref:Uncharacterized protein n=1 Tax=Synaphobranchus kaupii TaxID=118154 RepID=A0A9Q1J1N4_SYNKA|nr:hypothetical protein SKAU_G00180850 [Synaphobranchus kaupii]
MSSVIFRFGTAALSEGRVETALGTGPSRSANGPFFYNLPGNSWPAYYAVWPGIIMTERGFQYEAGGHCKNARSHGAMLRTSAPSAPLSLGIRQPLMTLQSPTHFLNVAMTSPGLAQWHYPLTGHLYVFTAPFTSHTVGYYKELCLIP